MPDEPQRGTDEALVAETLGLIARCRELSPGRGPVNGVERAVLDRPHQRPAIHTDVR